MSNRSDLIKIAAALSLRKETQFKLDAALESLRASPLSRIIREMLSESPSLRRREVFENIVALNQGRLEDLDSGEFRSYIIRKLGLTESELDSCIKVICSYVRVRHAANAGAADLLAAARSEDEEHHRHPPVSDVPREVRRRK